MIYEVISLVFIVYLVLKFSQAAEYYAKFTFFILGNAIVTAVLPYIGLLKYPVKDTRIGVLTSWGFRLIVQLLGLKYEVRGLHNINRDEGGLVLVAPHQSGLDVAVIGYILPVIGRGRVVAKKILLSVFPFGLGIWLCGTLFINRQNRKEAVTQLQMQCDAIQNRSNKIVIFPEGTRSQEIKFLPFKKGAFHLAIESQSMIQPVVVSKYHFLSCEKKYFKNGKIIISILPKISCKGMTKDDLPNLLAKTEHLMQNHFDELSNETK